MKKRVLITLILMTAILLPYASAGFFDFFNKDKVKLSQEAETNVSVTVGNAVPVIISVQQVTRGPSVGFVDLLAGTTANVYFNFSVRDDNGAADLNDASARAVFNKSAVLNSATGCVRVLEAGNVRTYQCAVVMNYYSEMGIWSVNVSIRDNSGNSAANIANTFSVQALKDISIAPLSISFPTVVPSSVTPVLSSANTTVTNKGNWEVPLNGQITIIAYDLRGAITPSEIIPAANFRASGVGTVCTTGTVLANGTSLIINNIALSRGAAGNTEDVAYCLTSVPLISSQTYSTQGGGSKNWKISI